MDSMRKKWDKKRQRRNEKPIAKKIEITVSRGATTMTTAIDTTIAEAEEAVEAVVERMEDAVVAVVRMVVEVEADSRIDRSGMIRVVCMEEDIRGANVHSIPEARIISIMIPRHAVEDEVVETEDVFNLEADSRTECTLFKYRKKASYSSQRR